MSFDREQLRTLHEVGKIVTASLDLDATLGAIVEAAYRLTGAQLLGILLLEDDQHLVIRVGRGDVAAAVGERVRADQGIVGRALRAQQPVLVPDMLAEPIHTGAGAVLLQAGELLTGDYVEHVRRLRAAGALAGDVATVAVEPGVD